MSSNPESPASLEPSIASPRLDDLPLLRARFAEARRKSEPIGVLRIRVERLERAAPERRPELLRRTDELLAASAPAAFEVARNEPDGRTVLVLGASRVEVEAFGRELVRAARKRGPTLGVGVAHDESRKERDFDRLLGVAEAGLEVAARGGGDRMVHTEQYEGCALHRVVEHRVADVEVAPASVAYERPAMLAPPPVPPVPSEPERTLAGEQELLELLRRALSGDTSSPGIAHFQRALEDLLREHPERDPAHERAGLLERRVHKLTAALRLAEGEIARLRQLRPGELGVASVYREVQGISDGAPLEALKRELMARIFEANAALQGARGDDRESDPVVDRPQPASE